MAVLGDGLERGAVAGMNIPRVLIIAGSDSGGGAGLQADLKTISALGAFGMTAITALTAQNTTGVLGIIEVLPEFAALQIKACAIDIGCDSVKTGMLANTSIIETVAASVSEHHLQPLVVDLVMISKSGAQLLPPDAIAALKAKLLPLATVVTPNLHEAAALVGTEIGDLEGMKAAARAIRDLGADNVVVKGGHLAGGAVDVLYDGREFTEFRVKRVENRNTHGTGCIFASAIAAHLARNRTVKESVAMAKEFVTVAIHHGLSIGKGYGPANPMAARPTSSRSAEHTSGENE